VSDRRRKLYRLITEVVLAALAVAVLAAGAPSGGVPWRTVAVTTTCPEGHPVGGWAVGIDLPDGDPRAEQDAVMEAHAAHCTTADDEWADKYRWRLPSP